MSEGDRVGPDTELWAPLLSNDFGQAIDSGLRNSVVGLSSITVNTRSRRDVDDATRLTVRNTEVWCGLSDELEWGSVVKSNDIFPLFVGQLVENTIPGIAGIVDNDVNFAITELSSLLDEDLKVFSIEHVACDCNGTAARLVDAVSYALCFLSINI